MFAYFGCNCPAEHSTITREERFYIENSLGSHESTKRIPTPWIKIMTSPPVWTLTQCGFVWGYWTLQTQTPLYMSGVMHFDLKSNSALSSLPYLVQIGTGPLFSCTSDALINKGICSIATTRNFMNFFGLFVPGIALTIVANVRIDQPGWAVALLVSAVAFNSACMSGFIVNHMDLSPNHAGILMGISNAISHCCAIIALIFAQYVVTDEGNINQWKIMFYFAAGFYMSVTILFFISGSGTRQLWNDEEQGNSNEQKTKKDRMIIALSNLALIKNEGGAIDKE